MSEKFETYHAHTPSLQGIFGNADDRSVQQQPWTTEMVAPEPSCPGERQEAENVPWQQLEKA